MRLSPQFKVSRQLSENIWQSKKLTPKQKIIAWKFRNKARPKQSDFSKNLQNYKKLSIFYGGLPIAKMQKMKAFTYSNKQKSLFYNLEKRLDVLLVRIFFCDTIYTARQWISHKKICVNGQVVSLPGFICTYGDIISVHKNHALFVRAQIQMESQTNRVSTKPAHIEVNYKTLNAIFLYEPQSLQIPFDCQIEGLQEV